MGVSDSRLLPLQKGEQVIDQITTISNRSKQSEIDSSLEKLKNLQIAGPLLKAPSTESSLTELLLKRSPSQGPAVEYGAVDPTTTAELFALFHQWQKDAAIKISNKQEDLGFKIDAAEALAMKLLQRFNYSASTMKTSALHLQEVHALKDDVKNMKQKLNEVLANYEGLCKRIDDNGPDYLKTSTRRFSAADLEAVRVHARSTRRLLQRSSSTK
ncbi:hypothetical protein O6H91_05G124500 [Diphasiastrum complanatum]|nr:hypothetical protein O6H91_05G124500 [Diphasiastrum complanatum]